MLEHQTAVLAMCEKERSIRSSDAGLCLDGFKVYSVLKLYAGESHCANVVGKDGWATTHNRCAKPTSMGYLSIAQNVGNVCGAWMQRTVGSVTTHFRDPVETVYTAYRKATGLRPMG